MSYEATTAAWAAITSHPSLSGNRRLVLLALAECHNKVTGQCNPSLARLHEMTGLKIHTITPAIRDLESVGLLSVCRAFGKGSSYELTLTYAGNGTTAEMGAAAENGITPMPKTAQLPMPKTAYKPGTEPGRNQETTTATSSRASQTEDKQPSGASDGGQGRHEGEPDKPVERKRKAAEKIPMVLGWMPDETLWDDFDELGIDRKFAESCLPTFRRCFIAKGLKRPGWELSFLKWVRRDWEMEIEKRQQGGTNVTPLRPAPSGHRNGSGNFRTFEQMRADNTQRAIDEFIHGDNVGVIFDA